jgi:hypothetical protein
MQGMAVIGADVTRRSRMFRSLTSCYISQVGRYRSGIALVWNRRGKIQYGAQLIPRENRSELRSRYRRRVDLSADPTDPDVRRYSARRLPCGYWSV